MNPLSQLPSQHPASSQKSNLPGDDSNRSNGNDSNALSDDSNSPPRVEKEVYLNSAAIEANSKCLPRECCSIATNHEATIPDLEAPCDEREKHENPASLETLFSEVEVHSDLSSESGFQSQSSPGQAPVTLRSENDLYGIQESLGAELERLPTDTSDAHDAWGSPHDWDKFEEKDRVTTMIFRKDPVSKLDIPSPMLKPPVSEITDLGDRGFYANLKENDRKPVDLYSLGSDHEKLDLQDQFMEALVKVHEEKKGFFPRALLSSLVTEDCVFNELTRTLSGHNRNQIRQYAKQICKEEPLPQDEDDYRPPMIKSFKKIFVILVLIEETSSITQFLAEDVNINDLDLPLSRIPVNGSNTRFHLRSKREPEKELECFWKWSQFKIRSFEEWQWTTISPFFHKGTYKDVKHFPLHDSVMLPFTMDSRRGMVSEGRVEFEGGFGRVFKVNIHRDHHNFDLRDDQGFAIKRLFSPNKEDFKREVEMLKMFSNDSHRHLISLLATYEYLKVYYLIFPWADSDLNEYWSKIKPTPVMDFETIWWVANQCEGIADGLRKVHRYKTSNLSAQDVSRTKRYGRHGDLKPDNVLWFSGEGGGILKISDFGLSEFSTVHSKSYKPRSRVATSAGYRPPECDIEGGLIGQSYDIWTLGCLYLEFITWLLGGWELLQEFRMKRTKVDPKWYGIETDTFFELGKSSERNTMGPINARVKPAVTTFMLQLHEHKSCTEFIHEFINMIRIDMLVVKSEDPFEKGRISSEKVHGQLAKMLEQCKEKEGYACKPTVWKPDDSVTENSGWRRIDQFEGEHVEGSQPGFLAPPVLHKGLSRRRSWQAVGSCECQRKGSKHSNQVLVAP